MKELRVHFPTPCAEPWDGMAPQGCNRICASCETTVVDLSELTIEDAERLISTEQSLCVRAEVDRAGQVRLRSNVKRTATRMIATIGVGTALLASTANASGKERVAAGRIAGTVTSQWMDGIVIATSSDGKAYSAKAKLDGKYMIRKLPPGSYAVHYVDSCSGEKWDAGSVQVAPAGTLKFDLAVQLDPDKMCIVVGRVEVHSRNG